MAFCLKYSVGANQITSFNTVEDVCRRNGTYPPQFTFQFGGSDSLPLTKGYLRPSTLQLTAIS